jgi:hypothetical protein
MRAGQRTYFVDILLRPVPNALGETDPNAAAQSVWTQAWANKRGIRGGEMTIARETSAQTIEEFRFDYADVMDPIGDGRRLDESMTLRGVDDGQLYDLDGVYPDETARKEVRVLAIRKRLAV